MLIPKASAVYEFTVKKSRFIALAQPVDSPEAARALLADTRTNHPDAAHVVHSFITGTGREHQGLSDDGEPAGTAGKPVWEILKGREITNILVLVVRYYGGTKLGTGGLVKAYGDAARGVLDLLKTEELIAKKNFRLSLAYPAYEGAVMKIREHQGDILSEDFGTRVVLTGTLPDSEADHLSREIRDLTAGRTEIEWPDPLS